MREIYKENMCKKIIAILMATTMMFTLNGCGKKKEESEQDVQATSYAEMMYDTTLVTINGMEGEPDIYSVKNDKVYIHTHQLKEGYKDDITDEKTDCDEQIADGNLISNLYCMNTDGSELQEIPIKLQEGEHITSFAVDNANNIYMIITGKGKEDFSSILVKIEASGNELIREEISKSLKIKSNTNKCDVLVDANNNVVIVTEQNIYVLNENLQLIGEIEVQDEFYILDAAFSKDGQLVCVQEKMSSESSLQAQILDIQNKVWGETIYLNIKDSYNNDILMDGLEYDFYYKDDSGIFGYDITGKKETMLVDYVISDLNTRDTDGIVAREDNNFFGIIHDNETMDSSIAIYSKINSTDLESRKVIIYGCWGAGEQTKRAVARFNRENKEYRIEIKEYMNLEDPVATMNAEIAAGKSPDIIDVSAFGTVEEYVKKGLLEDLTPYYEKDLQIGMDDIIPSVLESMKIDGKVYYVTNGFCVYSLVGRTKDVGDKTGWTFDEMKQLLEEKGDYARPFEDKNKMGMLDDLLRKGLSDFVDWETGRCSFESQDFKDILEICNERGVMEEGEFDEEEVERESLEIREGKVLFCAGNIAIDDIQITRQIFGEEITFIGYPNEEKQGSYFEFYNQIGISSQSKEKDAAWKFVRILMSKEFQGTVMDSEFYYMPTRQDCFDLRIKAEMATEAYVDEFGREIEPTENYSYDVCGLEIKRGPLTKEDVDLYVNLVNNTKKSGSCDVIMLDIVMEEAQKYFEGDKELDETVEIIQKRVETYINEQR